MALLAFCLSCTFLILELILPDLIYINLALACFMTGGAILLGANTIVTSIVFILSLAFSFLIVRPKVKTFLSKIKRNDTVKSKYIGKIVDVVENTNKDSGILSVNNERWQARTVDNETIEQGQKAKITDFKDVVMYIERI